MLVSATPASHTFFHPLAGATYSPENTVSKSQCQIFGWCFLSHINTRTDWSLPYIMFLINIKTNIRPEYSQLCACQCRILLPTLPQVGFQ